MILKAHEAMGKKIRLMQAAGAETGNLVKSQAALAEALSSEKALLIAETIERRAANNALLQEAIARNAASAAAVENAAATKVVEGAMHGNAGAMREVVVMARELERGNYSRLAGSASILAGRLDLLQYAFTPVGAAMAAAGVAAYGMYKHFEEANEHVNMLADSTRDLDDILSGMEGIDAHG
jgi:hypothetical protein